jgi:hypothetical protein
MAAAIYGSGFLELAPKLSDNFAKDLEGQTGSATQRVGDSMERTGGKLTKSVTLPILAAGAGIFALAGKQEDAEMKMVSSFDSMGAAAWTTTDALKAQASAFQELTTFGDESILEMQGVLLTFGNVTDDVFTDATRLGLDMSAKLGTDLQGSAIQLGKALNDPVKGISALSRAGVSFTQDQKDMVKEMQEGGDMAGAQALILSELEKQFGGTAAAMAQTGTGQAKQAMNSLGDAGESIGQFLIPVVSKFAGWMKTLAERFQALSPEAQQWIVRIAAVAAAVGPVLLIGGKLIKTFGMIGKAFGVLSKLMMANPWVLLIAAVVALVVVIVKNWDTIVGFLTKVWDGIKNAASAVGTWISDKFQEAVDFVKNLFFKFTPLGIIISKFDEIKDLMTGVKDWIGDRIDDVVEFFTKMPERIGNVVGGLFDGLKDAFKNAVNWIIDKWNNFKLEIKLPGILGGGTIGLDTPNIPRFKDGVDRVPGGRNDTMLALLHGQERVLSAVEADEADTGTRGGGHTFNLYGTPQDLVNKVSQEVAWVMGT